MYKIIDGEFYKTEKIDMQDILSMLNSTAYKNNTSIQEVKLEIEKYNLGKPICPDVEINPKNWGSETIPQVCEYKGNWYYNREGAIQECKYLGKRMPTKEEWGVIVKPYGNDGNKLSKDLGLVFAGYRYRNTGYYYNQSTTAYYWSSSPTSTNSYYLNFTTSNIFPTTGNSRANGFSVRCIKN